MDRARQGKEGHERRKNTVICINALLIWWCFRAEQRSKGVWNWRTLWVVRESKRFFIWKSELKLHPPPPLTKWNGCVVGPSKYRKMRLEAWSNFLFNHTLLIQGSQVKCSVKLNHTSHITNGVFVCIFSYSYSYSSSASTLRLYTLSS